MSQKELLINFVFDYTFYLTLFALVKIINGISAYMLWMFHGLVTDFSPSSFKFFNYLKPKPMPPTEGFFLGYIPIFTVFAINSLLMVGYLLEDFFDAAGSTPYENNEIFDSILSTYKQFAVVTNLNAQKQDLGYR